jgi:hypothetical protein
MNGIPVRIDHTAPVQVWPLPLFTNIINHLSTIFSRCFYNIVLTNPVQPTRRLLLICKNAAETSNIVLLKNYSVTEVNIERK